VFEVGIHIYLATQSKFSNIRSKRI
jgi:hypothetical protein